MDVRKIITDQIIAAMEAGPPPWRKTWVSGQGLATNYFTSKPYHGVNQVLLGMAGQCQGQNLWLTYRQAQSIGAQVRNGEQGCHVIKMVEVDRRQAEREAAKEGAEVIAQDGHKALVMKVYTVFNVNQVDGLPPLPEPGPKRQIAPAVEAVIFGLQETGMKLNIGGGEPAYIPRLDRLDIPPASCFESLDAFHSVLLHEAGHASGHMKRLARFGLESFGPMERAREELIAELASVYTGQLLGLPPPESLLQGHAAYVASWLTLLKGDKGEIFRAAAQAQKVADYLGQWMPEADLANLHEAKAVEMAQVRTVSKIHM